MWRVAGKELKLTPKTVFELHLGESCIHFKQGLIAVELKTDIILYYIILYKILYVTTR